MATSKLDNGHLILTLSKQEVRVLDKYLNLQGVGEAARMRLEMPELYDITDALWKMP